MENVTGVTQWLRKKILEKGGNPERETLNLVPTKEDKNFFVDPVSYTHLQFHFPCESQ